MIPRETLKYVLLYGYFIYHHLYNSNMYYTIIMAELSLYLLSYNKNKFSYASQVKYNDFADKRNICCIKNFGDVVSNLIYIIGGLYNYQNDFQLCVYAILVGIGSTYYHWNPSMSTLFYDRLPMIFIISYIIHLKLEFNFIITLIIGLDCLIKWFLTYDLTNYAIFQGVPLFVLLLFGDLNSRIAVFLYLGAKYCENNDKKIYSFFNNKISGHTIKHILSGVVLFII